MRLVYPLVVERFLVTHDEGESIERKSPKRGKLLDVFEELVSVPELFLYDNFSLDVLLVGAVEHRVVTPKVRWRDKGFKCLKTKAIFWLCFPMHFPQSLRLKTSCA